MIGVERKRYGWIPSIVNSFRCAECGDGSYTHKTDGQMMMLTCERIVNSGNTCSYITTRKIRVSDAAPSECERIECTSTTLHRNIMIRGDSNPPHIFIFFERSAAGDVDENNVPKLNRSAISFPSEIKIGREDGGDATYDIATTTIQLLGDVCIDVAVFFVALI